ncbi:MAG: low molecular weight protein-tyrosine-phosphatase [Eubacteriales bacterium]
MKRVLFICLGNICRSTMAEFVCRAMVEKAGLSNQIEIASAATSTEALGWDVHQGTQTKLSQEGIPWNHRKAHQMQKADYDQYDYIIAMEQRNIRDLNRRIGDPYSKYTLLLDYTDNPRDIADPWYTGNFDDTYNDIVEGCTGLLEALAP